MRPQALLCALALHATHGAVPTGTLQLEGGASLHVAPAALGSLLPASKQHALHLTLRWAGGLADGCDPKVDKWSSTATRKDGVAVLAARSPNCTFADRAKAAAKAGLRAVVVYNTIEGIYRNRTYAEDKYDYDCSRGKGVVNIIKQAEKMDGFRTSPCAKQCDSGRCLVTGKKLGSSNEICCAWDTYTMMAGDEVLSNVDAVFITMQDADELREDARLKTPYPNALPISLWDENEEGFFSYSGILMWLLGVLTCAYAAHKAADDVRKKRRQALPSYEPGQDTDEEEEDPTFDLTPLHAVGFILIASTALIVLFYIDLHMVIVGMYALSAASTSAAVVFRPLFKKGLPFLARHSVDIPKIGDVLQLDLVSGLCGVTLAIWWLCVQHASYAWLFQDLFGICLCVLFLNVIKLSSLKVATLLLCMAFFYDIFFVFLSPLLFGESVMVRVATGKTPTKDADYCEKYPDDADCRSSSLPMLLLLPSGGGYTMLGLGDIVLPGLLVAFAARCDACSLRRRYFPLLVAGYAVGLGVANVAVAYFAQGQPALLYLVPCTLGPFLLAARRDGTLDRLWEGPLHLLDPTPVRATRVTEPHQASKGDDEKPLMMSI